MSVLICFSFLWLVLLKAIKGMPTLALLLAWFVVSPNFRIGDISIDSTYIIILVLGTYIILRDQKIFLPPRNVLTFLSMILAVNVLYVISWALFSRIDFMTMFTMFLGGLKIILILIECWHINKNVDRISYKNELIKTIIILAFVNSIAVIYELVDFNGSVKLLSEIFLNNQEIEYLELQTKWGKYMRFFGIFGYPMQLGLFSAYAFSFLLLMKYRIKKSVKIFLFIDILFLGIMSASKSFIFGMVISLILHFITTLSKQKQSKKTVTIISSIMMIIVANCLMFSEIYMLINNLFGQNIGRYYNYLANIDEVLSTRFGSNAGVLYNSTLFDVIGNNLILGVGASSINDEPVMDNAALMIMHNGGLVALCIVIGWYMYSIYRNRNVHGYMSLLIIILITGMGFQTWVAPISAWLIFGLNISNSVKIDNI